MAKSKKTKGASKKKAAKPEAPKRTTAQLLTDAQAYVKARAKELPVYKSIEEIIEATPNGRPARVVINCADPQVNGADESVCDGSREIAIQDLHQVRRCVPCQKRSVQIYRNRLAAKRRAELAKRRGAEKPKSKAKKKKAGTKK